MTTPASWTLPPAGRNAYIDTLRGWSIFGVVCIHFAGSFVTTDAFAWSPSFWLGLFLNQVFIFAVPLFIFLSGLLAGSSKSQATLAEYYRARFWRIGFPYLLISTASFFLLNHYKDWLALANDWERFKWLLLHVTYTGVEPTLYFIPLILALYIIQPVLKALPGWLNRAVPAVRAERFTLILAVLLLGLHITFGLLCSHGKLDYYVWGRPNPLFWAVYFFAGLHFRSLAGFLSTQALRLGAWIALGVAGAAMIWNFQQQTDFAVVGLQFELNKLDYAYSRPEMMLYDLTVVAGLAAGIVLGWRPRTSVISYLGNYTLEIYLWHILVLYYGAWRYADAMAACRQLPEMMILISAGAALLIASATDGLSRLRSYLRHHRLVLVEVP